MDILQPFDDNVRLLGKVLDLRAEKAQVIASNIANAETPGFAPVRYSFEADLAAALEAGSGIGLAASHPAHIGGPRNFDSVVGKVTVEETVAAAGDGNGVRVDEEMLALSENGLLYETAAQLLKKKLNLIKHVISGGQ